MAYLGLHEEIPGLVKRAREIQQELGIVSSKLRGRGRAKGETNADLEEDKAMLEHEFRELTRQISEMRRQESLQSAQAAQIKTKKCSASILSRAIRVVYRR